MFCSFHITPFITPCIAYLTRCSKSEIRELLGLGGDLFGSLSWAKGQLLLQAREHLILHPACLFKIDSHSRDSRVSKETVVSAATCGEQLQKRQQRAPQIARPLVLPTYSLYENTPFLALPSIDIMRRRLRTYIDAMGNDAMKKLPCLSCGCKYFQSEFCQNPIPLSEIPNIHNLVPIDPHPVHAYTAGMLLERSALTRSANGTPQGTICLKCYASLCKNTRPTFALSRGFWVGSVPEELQILTMAERLLVQLAFPRVYLVKLRPKAQTSSGAALGLPAEQLHDGLSGSICSVRMPPSNDIVDMLKGNLTVARSMPNPLLLLAHTISVAYVGFGKVPPYYLRNLFTVRRKVVLDALIIL